MAGRDLTLAVATATIEAVAGAHGVVGIGAIVSPLVRDLLQLQDEQAQSLMRLEQSVQQLVMAPWRTARHHLKECTLAGRSEKQVKASLRVAGDKLHDALGAQHPRSLAAAYIAYDLAVVLALTDDKKASQHYAAMAAGAATDAVIDSIRAQAAARNSARGLDAMLNDARQILDEARLTYERLSARAFGKLLGGRTRSGHQLAVDQSPLAPPEYWYVIVKGASTLCGRDLHLVQRVRLDLWLKYRIHG